MLRFILKYSKYLGYSCKNQIFFTITSSPTQYQNLLHHFIAKQFLPYGYHYLAPNLRILDRIVLLSYLYLHLTFGSDTNIDECEKIISVSELEADSDMDIVKVLSYPYLIHYPKIACLIMISIRKRLFFNEMRQQILIFELVKK